MFAGGQVFGGGSPIKSIQTGTVTIAQGSATGTAAITAVDATAAVLIPGGFTTTTTDVESDKVIPRIELTNGTTVTATLDAASANATRVVYFTVVEFQPGIVKSLQRGTISVTSAGATASAVITAVDTTKAFVVGGGWSTTDVQVNFNNSFLQVWTIALNLVSATTVTARVGVVPLAGKTVTVPYQVVEFN